MSVSELPIDLYPFLQFIFTAFLIAIGIIHLVKTTASKYFLVDEDDNNEEETNNFLQRRRKQVANCQKKNQNQMVAVANKTGDGFCAYCGNLGSKQCSGCKVVKYCSGSCQSAHWKAGHKKKCMELRVGAKVSACDTNSSKRLPRLKKVLFPYEDFVRLFNWENMVFYPCGLLNCGNSCYANVVLQCLSCTRPLIAYLLEFGHRKKCRRNDWCFLCELELHVGRSRFSRQPFSPMNILSRLPNIGANLGYGKQEDAHEFMRFAIDTMQSVCLDEFGGEKALHPSSQETTLIQYIFGGHLQSQVKCSECNKISYRHENMMDLTVEIQGDAESLEECLDQFTAEELLDGENMYKCEGCNDYVKASKRLAIHHAPNILTIALKRFQSGRFGKLNKRVAFPETLDMGPYMTEPRNGTDLYRLYAVVVHVDMLNASYFGHYICYTKDSHGNWHRIDDCRVTTVDLEEVLAQGAYMLLYSRTCVRPSFAKPLESLKEEKQEEIAVAEEAQPCSQEAVDSEGSIESFSTVVGVSTNVRSHEEEEIDPKPCLQLPVEGLFKTIPTDVRSSRVEPRSEQNDSACMNLGEPAEVNSRVGGAIMADVPIDGVKSNSRDMEIDSEFASSSCMQLDDCDCKESNSAGIGSSLEVINGGVFTSAPLTEAIRPSEIHGLNCEVSDTTSDKQIFEAGYRVCIEEPILGEVSVDNSLPSQSDAHELAETTCTLASSGLNSVPSNLQEGSSSSFCSPQKLKLEQVSSLESFSEIPAARITNGDTSRLVGYESCSNSNQRPVLYPGYLDECPRISEQCLNGAEPGIECSNVSSHFAEIAPVKLGNSVHVCTPLTDLATEAYDSESGHELKETNIDVEQIIENSNSSSSPQNIFSLPHQTDHGMNEVTSVPVVASGSDTEMLDISNHVDGFHTLQSPSLVHIASVESGEGVHEVLSSNINKVDSPSRRSKPVGSPVLDKQSKGKFHNRNDAPEGLGVVGSSCKVNNCNGSTNPGSLLQNGLEAHNYDRNLGCTDMLKSAKLIENMGEKILLGRDESIGQALGETGVSCNNIDENKTHNLIQTQGKDLLSPGFLNRPSRKNSLKKNCNNTSVDENERTDKPWEACDLPQNSCNRKNLFSPGFLNTSRKNSLKKNCENTSMDVDERTDNILREAHNPCNKGLFSPGFLNKPSQKNSLRKISKNTSMDEDDRTDNRLPEACDLPQSYCNGNDNGFCLDENRICDKNQTREMLCGNGNDIGSPGSRRRNSSMINDEEEGASLSEAASSNYDRSKLPRVG